MALQQGRSCRDGHAQLNRAGECRVQGAAHRRAPWTGRPGAGPAGGRSQTSECRLCATECQAQLTAELCGQGGQALAQPVVGAAAHLQLRQGVPPVRIVPGRHLHTGRELRV